MEEHQRLTHREQVNIRSKKKEREEEIQEQVWKFYKDSVRVKFDIT